MKVINAPTVLSEILSDRHAPARERIGAAKELRATAGESQQGTGEKFSIVINFGEHTTRLDARDAQPKPDPERTLEYRREGEAAVPPPKDDESEDNS